jgi:MinD superfamily P-loop ATPase
MERLPPLRLRETDAVLELTLPLFLEEVRLRLDKDRCIRCDVCSVVCPRQAVRLLPGEESLTVAIDPWLCVLCEVCSHFCPVGAITLTYQERPKAVLANHRALAPFFPKVELDPEKCPEPCPPLPEGEEHWCRAQLRLVPNDLTQCPKECRRCLAACPRQALVPDEAGGRPRPEPDACLRCQRCLAACEQGALCVTPQFRGRVEIDDRKCPPDCLKCIHLCPVKLIVREGPRVYLAQETCSLCGVCQAICDQDAVTLIREEVVAQEGRFSHAWEQAVARLLAPRTAEP